MLTSGSFIDLLKNTHKEIFNFDCGLFLMLHIAVIYKNYEFLYCLKIEYYIFACVKRFGMFLSQTWLNVEFDFTQFFFLIFRRETFQM